jgi:hypothetical protein
MSLTLNAESTVVVLVPLSHEEHQHDSRTAYLNKYIKSNKIVVRKTELFITFIQIVGYTRYEPHLKCLIHSCGFWCHSLMRNTSRTAGLHI